MNRLPNPLLKPQAFMTRREMLRRCGAGFGLVGLAAMWGKDVLAGEAGGAHPLEVKASHYPAKANTSSRSWRMVGLRRWIPSIRSRC